MKSKVLKIKLNRAEGPINQSNRKVEFVGGLNKLWNQANAQLLRWSDTAPEQGYDKVDFEVSFDDGSIYSGTYDLKHYSVENPDLARHIVDYCNFYAGRLRPSHLSVDKYATFLASFKNDALGAFVDEHEFDDVDSSDVQKFCIVNPVLNDDEQFLFWSNDLGWVDKSSALVFDSAQKERSNLPDGGVWHPV